MGENQYLVEGFALRFSVCVMISIPHYGRSNIGQNISFWACFAFSAWREEFLVRFVRRKSLLFTHWATFLGEMSQLPARSRPSGLSCLSLLPFWHQSMESVFDYSSVGGRPRRALCLWGFKVQFCGQTRCPQFFSCSPVTFPRLPFLHIAYHHLLCCVFFLFISFMTRAHEGGNFYVSFTALNVT